MRALLFMALVGCGSPFTAAASVETPDADRPDGGASEAADAGGEAEATTEAGPMEGATIVCETYYRAYATSCACRPPEAGPNACGALQYNDAGCTRSDLGRCEPACGWDGGSVDYGKFCACIYACLGTCAPTNSLYFACGVAWCGWQSCP